jgi:hypothetical protein
MSSIRTWHTYLGLLIAPSVLFFALTGALQLFGLHESHGSYQPAVLIEKLSSVHKDQVFAQKEHDDHGEHQPSTGSLDHSHDHEAHDEEPSLGTVLLKWYFLLVALSLIVSTVLGLWMGLNHVRHRRTGWVLVAIGTIVPIILIVV